MPRGVPKLLDPIIKTRIELYVPFVSNPNHEVVKKDLIEISSNFFGGCTVIQNTKGYYKDPKTNAMVPDMVDIFMFDVDDPRHQTVRDLNAFSKYIKTNLKQKVVYYAYYKIMATDVRRLQKQPNYKKYLKEHNISTF